MRTKTTKQIRIKKNVPLVFMALPAILILILFNYVPMFGLVLAFKDYTYMEGIFGSAWAGIKNFTYIFNSGEIGRTIGNTVMYHIVFVMVGTFCSVFLAIMLYYIRSPKRAKTYQKIYIAPYLVSYVIISYIVYIFLNSDYGLINVLLGKLGKEPVSWYTEASVWPFIFMLVQVWFGAGIKSVYYYGALMAIDSSILEAADIDGASRWKKTWHIMLPSIVPTICVFLILDLGNLLDAPFELFNAVPMDSSALYKVTDVLSTYTYRGLVNAEIGTTTALGLFTGAVTAIGTIIVNLIVKKVSPENSLF